MAKQKLTKSDRIQRESDLTDTMFYALSSPTKEHAMAWAKRAQKLMDGLSRSSIKRAQKRAHKFADELPPGFLKAMEAMGLFEEVIRHRKITKRDEGILWGAVAQVCMYQLAARRGDFYEAARDFHVLRDIQVEVVRLRPDDSPAMECDCPRCRPRTAEELN